MVMAALFLAPAAVLWAMDYRRGRAACDQFDFHLKAILKFAAEWPRPDVSDYQSATTPGYHILMAAVSKVLGPGPVLLQIVASVFTVLLVWVTATAAVRFGARRGWSWWQIGALVLPVVWSPYVFTAGVWLLPDNAGWLLALLVLLISLSGWMGPERVSMRALLLTSLLLLLTVLVRQSHLWIAGPFVIAAWLGRTRDEEGCVASALREPGPRVRQAIGAMMMAAPALVALAWFMSKWQGLTPPTFQVQHQHGVNLTTPAFFLALVGAFSPFFVAWWWPGLVRLWRSAWWWVIGAAAIGAILAAVPETTYLYEPRASGLWQVVRAMEARGIAYIGGRTSVLILALATIGAPMLAAWLTIIEGKRRWIIGSAIAAFVAAQCANANCWQRYHEPLILILFAWIAAGSSRPQREGGLLKFARWAGPVALAALLGALMVYGIATGDARHANP